MIAKHNPKRNARINKKLRTGAFQEFGFDIYWTFNSDVAEEQIDAIVDQLLDTVIEPNALGFSGSGHRAWEGVVCTRDIGQCTEEHRQALVNFFADKPVTDVKASELYDIWWG